MFNLIKELSSIKELQREICEIEFDIIILEKVFFYLDFQRYFIFSIDLYEFMKSFNSIIKPIDILFSCNKRNEIGKILNKESFKFLIVYYDTSKKFRFYVNTGMEVLRISKRKISRLDIFDFNGWIHKRCIYERIKCSVCDRSASFTIHYYSSEKDGKITLLKNDFCSQHTEYMKCNEKDNIKEIMKIR